MKPKIAHCSYIPVWESIKWNKELPNQSVWLELPIYSILLIAEGCGQLHTGNQAYELHAGICCLLPPNSEYKITLQKEGLEYYTIAFSIFMDHQAPIGANGSELFSEAVKRVAAGCESFSAARIQADTLYEHQFAENEIEQLNNQTRFLALFTQILKSFHAKKEDYNIREAIQKTIAYVCEHYDQPLTISELAASAAINRWQYTKTFKEMTGQIPIEFLNAVRIDKAQQLLLTTNDNLQQIAHSVGYNNEYYFNRKFKQKVGVTPGQYRSGHAQETRFFAPFLEDYLVALEVTPVIQCAHKHWGRQEYLGMNDVPQIDISSKDWSMLSMHKPQFIFLDEGYHRWNLDQCSRISPIYKLPSSSENWRKTLLQIASIIGRKERAQQVIAEHEQKIATAHQKLKNALDKETVAVLRFASNAIYLYGGPNKGYTGPLLYDRLGLNQPQMVQQMPPHERRMKISLDMLSALDAEHLFITFDREQSGGAERHWLSSEAWNTHPAVKAKRVYEVDFWAWMNYGVLSHNRKIDDLLLALG